MKIYGFAKCLKYATVPESITSERTIAFRITDADCFLNLISSTVGSVFGFVASPIFRTGLAALFPGLTGRILIFWIFMCYLQVLFIYGQS